MLITPSNEGLIVVTLTSDGVPQLLFVYADYEATYVDNTFLFTSPIQEAVTPSVRFLSGTSLISTIVCYANMFEIGNKRGWVEDNDS